jgi:hypothetical protein
MTVTCVNYGVNSITESLVNILTSSSFGVSTLRKLYVVKVLNRLDVPTVSSDVRDNNELNVSHGRPENSSVVSEAFGNTVNTIVDTMTTKLKCSPSQVRFST